MKKTITNCLLVSALALLLSPSLRPAPDALPPGPTLFLPYAGPANMRLFGLVLTEDSTMYVVGGDAAAVGVDGYISKVTPAGKEERLVAFKTHFVGPGVDLGAHGELYIAGGDSIYKISPDGRVETLRSDFRGAFDIKLGPKGNLYVADHSEGKIFRITPAMEKTVLVDYHLTPGFFVLGGLAFDADQTHLYSFELGRRTLWRYPMKEDGTVGAPETVLANAPALFAFAIDSAGNIIGTDFDKGELVRIDPKGNLTRLPGTGGLKHPIGFRLGKKGFHPDSAFLADDEGIKKVLLPAF